MTRLAPQWIQNGTYPAGVDRRLIGALWPIGAVRGCAVSAGTGMQVQVAAGWVAVPTANNTGSTLCTADAAENVTISTAPASGLNRIDVVTCHPRGNDLDGGANDDWIYDVIVGAVAASPVAPAVPAGQVALAQVFVPGGAASIVAGNLTDLRVMSRQWNTAWGREGREVGVAGSGNFTVSGTWYDVVGATIGPWTPVPNRLYVAEFSGVFANNATGLASLRIVNAALVQLPNALSTFWGGTAAIAQYPQRVRSTTFSLPATPVTHKAQFLCGSTDMRTNAAPVILTIDDVGPVPGTLGPAG